MLHSSPFPSSQGGRVGAQWVVTTPVMTWCGLKSPPYSDCSPIVHLDLRIVMPRKVHGTPGELEQSRVERDNHCPQGRRSLLEDLNAVLLPAVNPVLVIYTGCRYWNYCQSIPQHLFTLPVTDPSHLACPWVIDFVFFKNVFFFFKCHMFVVESDKCRKSQRRKLKSQWIEWSTNKNY